MIKQTGKLAVSALPILALGIIASRHPVLYAHALDRQSADVPQVAPGFRLCDPTGAVLTGTITTSFDAVLSTGANDHKRAVCALEQARKSHRYYYTVNEVLDLGEPRDVFCVDVAGESTYLRGHTPAVLSGSDDRIHYQPAITVYSPGMQRISGRHRFWRMTYPFNQMGTETAPPHA